MAPPQGISTLFEISKTDFVILFVATIAACAVVIYAPWWWGMPKEIIVAVVVFVGVVVVLQYVFGEDTEPPAAGGEILPNCLNRDGGINNINCKCGDEDCTAGQICTAAARENKCSDCAPTYPPDTPTCGADKIIASRSSGALTSCNLINGGNARCHGACDQCVGFDFDLRSWHNCVQDPDDEEKCINSTDRCIGPGEHIETNCMDRCDVGSPPSVPGDADIVEYTAKGGSNWTAADYVVHRNTGTWGEYADVDVRGTWNNERWHVGAIYTQSGLVSCNDIFVDSGVISGVDVDEEEFTMHQCYGEEGEDDAHCGKCYGYHPSSGTTTNHGKWYQCENLSSLSGRQKCKNKDATDAGVGGTPCRMTGP